MNTITVTCPEDREQFAVVEPKNHSQNGSLTVTCPSCGARFAIVYPDEIQEPGLSKPTYEPISVGLTEWELRENPPEPYTGRDESIPCSQYMIAKIAGPGGVPESEESVLRAAEDYTDEEYEELLKPNRFQIWYTPDHDPDDGDRIAYVVRADLLNGIKTKNVYRYRDQLFAKNRGVPRDSDKQWTYLDRAECYARAAQAQLPGELAEVSDKEGRYNIFLGHNLQPLVDDEGEVAEELVLELARVLLAFQTEWTA